MTIRPHIECPGRRIGYARVSTTDQKLRMQLDVLKAVNCHPIFTDHGVSGAKSSRPGLDRMLKALKPGDTVVVFKLDRLGRSVLHLSDLLVRFQQEGIHFCSISEAINTTTPGGKLVYHMFSAFAEFQRDIIIENTIAGMEAARRRGKHIGRPYRLCPRKVLGAHAAIHQRGQKTADVARRYGVSRMTLSRAFRRLELVS
ncbi:recombinase family protein [uncultured Roseibium sp.]|uniref:recombinase family protein n=1 Tax=uncultured Roseibium sp. TaxID=1936171 RepID=UPI003217788B